MNNNKQEKALIEVNENSIFYKIKSVNIDYLSNS